MAGVIVGYLLGGRARNLVALPFGPVWLIWLAGFLQILALAFVPARFHIAVLLTSYGLVACWLIPYVTKVTGAARVGVLLAATGWLMNFVVIAANGGMPVSRSALARVGIPATEISHGNLYKHVAAGAATNLRFLGDVVPVLGLGIVVSAGDIVLALAIAVFVAASMHRVAGEGSRVVREISP